MKHGMIVIVMTMISSTICGIIRHCVNRELTGMSRNNFLIKAPNDILWINVFGIVVAGASVIFCYVFADVVFKDMAVWLYFLYGSFVLFNIYMIVSSLTYEIRVIGNVMYSRHFGRKKAVMFYEITDVEISEPSDEGYMRITVKKNDLKLFSVQSNFIGYDIFVKRLEDENILKPRMRYRY